MEKKGFTGATGCVCGPQMQKAILELAQKLDLKVDNAHNFGQATRGVYWNGYRLNWWNAGIATEAPIAEFLRMMEEEAAKPEPVVISGHAAEFKNGYVKVGCTTVTNEQVREIYARLVDIRPAPAQAPAPVTKEEDDIFGDL